METEQQTDAVKKMQSGLWIAALIFGAIIIGALLLFILPSPQSSGESSEVATTTEEVTAETAASPEAAKPAPSGTTSNYPAAGSRFMQNGVYVTVIHFNGKSFSPNSLTVNRGEEVRFVNTSNLTMDVGSQNPNASSPAYSALNQPMAKGKGGTYQIALTETGVWAYANQTGGTTITGVVNVR
jgi:plastocyanin